MGETVLAGQGDMHLKGAMERLASAFGVKVVSQRPTRAVPARPSSRPVHQHGRLKRQTGGHGQFADVKLDIAPRERGQGFQFVDKIVGGAVPRNFIPAVGEAAEEAARKGAFGYPVVDISVTLVDGGFHAVDSSDMAFRTATRMAMQEALPKADPVLLEPLHKVTVTVPNNFTATAQRLLTGRRGQILGYGEKPGWSGWDEVEAIVPESNCTTSSSSCAARPWGSAPIRHASTTWPRRTARWWRTPRRWPKRRTRRTPDGPGAPRPGPPAGGAASMQAGQGTCPPGSP